MRSIEKALSVIEFMMEKGQCGVTEISTSLNLNKNNVFRILITLEKHKIVEKDELTDRYHLSTGAVVLGYGFIQKHPLVKLSSPLLKTLRIEINETVNLCMLDDTQDYITYVAQEETLKSVRVKSRLGKRFSIKENLSSAKALKRALEGEGGFVYDYEYDTETGVAGASCVIRDYKGRPLGAVEVIAPLYRLSLESIKGDLKKTLENYALDISLKLGYWD